MKTKKSAPVVMFLAITILAYIVASVVFCYTTKPAVSEGEFPFSITYAYQGETQTLSGVLKCRYAGSNTIHREHQRYWDEEILFDNPKDVEAPFIIDQNEELQTTLSIHENMNPGYFMGDPALYFRFCHRIEQIMENHYREGGNLSKRIFGKSCKRT